MTSEKKTLGQAIDEIVAALSALDENARSTAIEAACAHLGLNRPASQPAQARTAVPLPDRGQVPAEKAARSMDIRALKEEKQPESATEMACLVAFYLQQGAPENERKDVVTTEDLKKYFKQAHFPLPKRIQQLLINARHAGYFDLAERGAYKLNAVGYNLVAHNLPKSQQGGR